MLPAGGGHSVCRWWACYLPVGDDVVCISPLVGHNGAVCCVCAGAGHVTAGGHLPLQLQLTVQGLCQQAALQDIFTHQGTRKRSLCCPTSPPAPPSPPSLPLPAQGSKKLVVIDSLSKFYDHIEPSSLKLPESTAAYETDQQAMVRLSVRVCMCLCTLMGDCTTQCVYHCALSHVYVRLYVCRCSPLCI